MYKANKDVILYLDIDDYRSAVDIYHVVAGAHTIPDVEKDVPFTYMKELCKYVESHYPKAYYIVPDKFWGHTPGDFRYFTVSHRIRLDDRELLKILNFRIEERERMKNEKRPSYPHYYEDPVGYEHPYIPIPLGAKPIIK